MNIIRTHEELARVIASSPDAALRSLLTTHAEQLAHYALEDVAEFVIVQPGDTTDVIEEACQFRLIAGGAFVSPVEFIAEHPRWFEVIWILSDDGFGLVLLVSKAPGTHPELLAACRYALL